MPRIYSVHSVSVQLLKSKPSLLSIQALGTASSSGWKNARLIPHIYVIAPPDGIYDFDFEADRPTGISRPVMSPIGVAQVFPAPPDIKGVRIHATSNSQEALITSGHSLDIPHLGLTPAWDGDAPWPDVFRDDRPVPWPWLLKGDSFPFPFPLSILPWPIPNGQELVGHKLRVLGPEDVGDASVVPGRVTIRVNDTQHITSVVIEPGLPTE